MLFPLFALALNLPENFFEDKVGRNPDHADKQIRHPAAIMRLLYYPALGDQKADQLALGIGVSHSCEHY